MWLRRDWADKNAEFFEISISCVALKIRRHIVKHYFNWSKQSICLENQVSEYELKKQIQGFFITVQKN